MTHIFRACALMTVSLLVAAGCGREDATAPAVDEPAAYALADTPDQLVANFVRAHDEMNLTEYDRLLHEEFEFHFLPQTGSTTASSQMRGEELSSADRVFHGRKGRNDDGSELAPVSTLRFRMDPIEPWQPLGHDRQRRTYQASMTVFHEDGSVREVAGLQQLTVAQDGDEFRLLVWRDLGDS
jgi:hypothetical protein